jgi:ribosomal protein S27AE
MTEFHLTDEHVESMSDVRVYTDDGEISVTFDSTATDIPANAIEIVCTNKTFKPGVFEYDVSRDRWQRKRVEHNGDCPSCGKDVSLSIAGIYGEWVCNKCGVTQHIK